MKNLIILISLTLISAQTYADCKVALGFLGGAPKVEMANKLKLNLIKELKGKNSENDIFLVGSPDEASSADYYYLVTPSTGGFKVSVNNLLLNNTFYTNTYIGSSFHSENDVVKVLAKDFVEDILPNLKYCK